METKRFKISKTERTCLVIERLACQGVRACAIGIIGFGTVLLGAALVRQINHKSVKH